MTRRRKIVTRGRIALVVGHVTEAITNIPRNAAKKIIFQCLLKSLRPYWSIATRSGPDKFNLRMGTSFSSRRTGMRRKQFRRLYLKKTGTSRIVLSIYYATSCTAVNTHAETRRLSMINKGTLGIPCKLAYHVLLGGIHVKPDGIVLELFVFDIKRHATFIICLLLSSVFLGKQSTGSTANSLSSVREPRVVFSGIRKRADGMRGALSKVYPEHSKGMKSCIFRTFHNPRGLVFDYTLLIRIVHIQSMLVIAGIKSAASATESGGNATNGLTNTADD